MSVWVLGNVSGVFCGMGGFSVWGGSWREGGGAREGVGDGDRERGRGGGGREGETSGYEVRISEYVRLVQQTPIISAAD